MILLAFAGGALTILSPCILPVLPFVFARADKPFLRNGLPMLAGMTLMFAAVATLAALGGGWVVAANQYGRAAALLLLAGFGVTLLFPALADRLTRPIVALGDRLSRNAGEASGFLPSALLGIATGLLWAPCAGPILGIILTGAVLQGPGTTTTFLLFAYAAGAAASLALALLVGGRLFRAMKRSLGVGEWIRRAAGGAVLLAVVAIALGLDTGFLSRVSLAGTTSIEERLLGAFQMNSAPEKKNEDLAVEGRMPPLSGAVTWLNSGPLTAEALQGKVVVIDFWTYSCINCLRSLPYVRAWAQKYRDQGLVVIGVHTPEFAFEHDVTNVQKALRDLGITYPVAVDNNYAIWRAFNNHFWPAHYFIDARGRVRHHHFGEGDYVGSERVIQKLLTEARAGFASSETVQVSGTGAEAAAARGDVRSPETYVGYARGERFASNGGIIKDRNATYRHGALSLNKWALAGDWTVGGEHAILAKPGGRIAYRFHARDLHLVLGASNGKPVRFRVTIDGKAPDKDRGVDIDAAGNGIVTGERLYQLVRQNGPIRDRTFEIEFLDAGVRAFAFTFG
nr:cytochrome c biogenesis protein DipZ [Sphingobium sp. AS12]